MNTLCYLILLFICTWKNYPILANSSILPTSLLDFKCKVSKSSVLLMVESSVLICELSLKDHLRAIAERTECSEE